MYSMRRDHMHRQEQSEINVVGAGTQLATPNIVEVSFNFNTQGKDLYEIEMANNKRVEQVVKMLDQFGIKDKNINIQEEILIPLLDIEGEIIGYQASTFINVIHYNLATLKEFYINAKGMDIKIDEITLMVEDVNKYYYLALNEAVVNAYNKAKNIAETMNVKLFSTPIILTETSNIENIINEIIITHAEEEDIRVNTIVIPATVEAKFLIEQESQL